MTGKTQALSERSADEIECEPITARRNGKCALCNDPVQVGEDIVQVDVTVAHLTCATQAGWWVLLT